MFGWQYLNRQQESEPEVLLETQEPDTATTEPTATPEATAVAMSERYGAIIQSPEELTNIQLIQYLLFLRTIKCQNL